MISGVVPITIELGSALSSKLLDGPRGVLLDDAIPAARAQLFEELGIELPEPLVKPNRALSPSAYAIAFQEIPVASGEILESVGETPFEVAADIARHLRTEVRRSAAHFIGLQEVQTMLDELERTHPALVRNVVPKPVSLVLLTEILRNLVAEGVSVRPLAEILDALALHAPAEKDSSRLTEAVRAKLRRYITHAHARADGLPVVLIDPSLEDILRDAIQQTPSGPKLALAPSIARDVVAAVRAATERIEGPAVLLTQPDVRRFLFRLLEVELPGIIVLGHRDLDPAITVKPIGHVAL